jgi:hypothetical protein
LLTFKSTSAWKPRLMLAGFQEYDAGATEKDVKRRIFVPPEIRAVLGGGTSSPPGFPCAEADAFFARYRYGWIVKCSRQPKGKADFKWLQDHDEVWVLSFKGAGAQWRMLGRFAAPALFVGLLNLPRSALEPWAEYQAKATETIAEWQRRFPECEPFRGKTFDDYIGYLIHDKDN